MAPPPVRLALVWHMHQPYYLDPETGESVLPWVRLHALKDYWGMVAVLDEFPTMRATVNLVPSLVEQVVAYAEERTWDRGLVLGLKPADALDRAEGEWLVREGFHAHAPTMIEPYPRYAELWRQRLERRAFDTAALRDLQVWQKLVWVDPDVAASDPSVRRLFQKGRGFDEDDKASLRAVELDVLRRVVPAYARAAARGQVELATSPYYHPILPLLCDSAAHHDAHPGAPLPDPPFRWPEDADAQLARAITAHTAWFGERPRGVWPSEGSVSPAAAAAIARAGFSWLATDEDILRRSRAAAGLETPAPLRHCPHEYASADGPVRLLFRDHALSDAVGFIYQRWPAAAAADDFLARVRAAASTASAGRQATVTVILDGENAWEHYAGGGRPFLRALYQRLSAARDVRPVTASEAVTGQAEPLPHLFSGSWIHADFGIWIGHADDRRAWGQLASARQRFDERRAGLAEAPAAEALDALHAAEGSDWFWWYGDDHSSAHDRDFDALFRRHLRRAWRAMGEEPPAALFDTNVSTAVPGDDVLTIAVASDADGSTFFDGLGLVPLERPGGTMQRGTASVIRRCDVGLSAAGLVARVEAVDGVAAAIELSGAAPLVVPIDGAGRVVIGWPALAETAVARVRLVVRDAAGRVIETVPADGLGRLVAIPAPDGPVGWTA
jgi:alpha-amylase/alpha-mannosidase (GH57 family)